MTLLKPRGHPARYFPALWDDDVQSVVTDSFVVIVRDVRYPAGTTTPQPEWFDFAFGAPPPSTPDLQRQVRELGEWTGWSSRKLQQLLRTSHTTIQALQRGRRAQAGRSGNLPERIEEAHAVISRIYRLAGTPERTARALERGEPSAVDQLCARRPTRAYLAALDVLRPRETNELLVGGRPARGAATAALTD